MTNQVDNKLIAKNTIALYFRMLFTMAVSLYTSRVVLNTLGIVDYGIYNVVGGIVTMFAFLNGAMITSTQRYITFELGKGNMPQLKVVFTTCVQIHLLISLIIIILGETIGLWFLYEKMVIPEERFSAAMWVYQLSILTMCVQVMSVPYNSDIVAHEQMGIFAAISVIEVVLKLAVVYMLAIGNLDKLILYAVLIAIIQLLIRFFYTKYCNKHFAESQLIWTFDKQLAKEMGKFAGWNIWGNMAAMLMGTGLNMLLNFFFGPIVNAARGIAVQVEGAVAQFSTNFLMAVNPQITKLYAQNNLKEMHTLLFRASKFAYFLMFVLSLPIVMETKPILILWLKIVPDHTVIFLRLLLVIVLIDAVARPLMTSAAATGNVKKYQTVIGGILLSIVPVAYLVLKLGGTPASVYIVYLCVSIVAFISRLLIIRPLIGLSLLQYAQHVIMRIFLVTAASFITMLIVRTLLPVNSFGILVVCVSSVAVALVVSYTLGLTKNEQEFVRKKVAALFTKFHH